MNTDPVIRVRRLALRALLDAGGAPRLALIERAGLVVRASTLPLRPPPAAAAAAPPDNSLLAAYCRGRGIPVPSRFRSQRHLMAMSEAMRHGRRS